MIMKTIIKANGISKSGKTYYFNCVIPAGVVTVKEGVFCGSSTKEYATIEEIGWMYSFGKKYFSVTRNGKWQIKDYAEIIKKYYKN